MCSHQSWGNITVCADRITPLILMTKLGPSFQTHKWLRLLDRFVLSTFAVMMGKIIFYEGRNFEGRHYECTGDCADMHAHFSRCNSIRVDSGCWMAYEKPNYSGYQYMLTRGKYPDHHRWSGFNDCVRSCRMIPAYNGTYRMKIFERSDFGGKVMELSDDCPNLHDRFHLRDVFSCNVMEGYWILHEHPNYRGRQYFLRPGEYNKHSDWGSLSTTIGSVRRITEIK